MRASGTVKAQRAQSGIVPLRALCAGLVEMPGVEPGSDEMS